jgi:hypothetical protein
VESAPSWCPCRSRRACQHGWAVQDSNLCDPLRVMQLPSRPRRRWASLEWAGVGPCCKQKPVYHKGFTIHCVRPGSPEATPPPVSLRTKNAVPMATFVATSWPAIHMGISSPTAVPPHNSQLLARDLDPGASQRAARWRRGRSPLSPLRRSFRVDADCERGSLGEVARVGDLQPTVAAPCGRQPTTRRSEIRARTEAFPLHRLWSH